MEENAEKNENEKDLKKKKINKWLAGLVYTATLIIAIEIALKWAVDAPLFPLEEMYFI